MKIVAFMQNPWFPPGTEKRHIELYSTDQDFHRRLLSRTMSGVRLMQAFGKPLFEKIWWDNVSPAAAEEASGDTGIDAEHVERVIDEQKPELILTFGNNARDAIENSLGADVAIVMNCHHPNARYKTQQDLADFAMQVQQLIEKYDKGEPL